MSRMTDVGEIEALRRALNATIVERDGCGRALDKADTKLDDLRREIERLTKAEDEALRVLYHVIATNQHWETQRPNELTDDAIRIGHEFLIDRGRWPGATAVSGSNEASTT